MPQRVCTIMFLLAGLVFVSIKAASACTTMLVTKGASADGSVIVAHSDDNHLMDQRIIYVPAADHKPGSKRKIVYDYCCFGGNGPRYVGTDRGPGYSDKTRYDGKDYPLSQVLGEIDQVPHTYAYFDASYGVMNEHQLMIGECTDGSKFTADQKAGERLFYSAELSRVALERCKTAREAIVLMGELMEKFGYYGTGETLLVADSNEGWVIEMCAVPQQNAGIWVAKRIPDGEVFVAANEFRIRDVEPGDPNTLYSKDLFKVVEKAGWWKPADGKFDWLKAVSDGEYNHPYYSLRRVWRLMSRLAPSSKFNPWVEDGFTRAYPLSIKPEKKVSTRDVIGLFRDHYEGTEFDMTKGLAAGPFGSPTRYFGPYEGSGYDVNTPGTNLIGAWERPISVFYCGHTWVTQARSWLPDAIGGVCWFGTDAPAETCFVPFYAGMTDLPLCYQSGPTEEYCRKSAWWAFNHVANLANLKYSYMIKDIRAKQEEFEGKAFEMQSAIDMAAQELFKKNPERARQYLTDYCIDHANRVVGEWWNLADNLMARYDDGYVNSPTSMATKVGYPAWWLKEAGYDKGPVSYKKPSDR